MKPAPPSKPPAPLLRLYTAALWLYPRRQRRRFGDEMMLMLEESWRVERLGGSGGAWGFWSAAFRDLLRNALLLRVASGRIRNRKQRPALPSRLPHSEDRSSATRSEVLLENALQDLRYALRTLRRAPGFAAAVVLTLALGIGANAAIFSVLDAVVLAPFPYPAAEQLVNVWTRYPEQGIDIFPVSRAEFVDYRAASELFEAMFAYRARNVTLTGTGTPQRIAAAEASADIWKVLGARAAHGRLFGATEDVPGNDRVVVLDHGFWQQTFGADPGVVGHAITLDGFPLEIIGVAAPGVALPDAEVALYTPLAIDTADLADRSGHGLTVLGRTRPGTSLDDVLAEMEVVGTRWQQQYAHFHPFNAQRLADRIIGDARRPLFLLAGAVGFVLLIACANVAGLLMAHTTARRREMGVRAALGAPRHRLAGQVVAEGLVLATFGGALGGLASAYGTRLLLRLEPGDLPRVQEAGADGGVVAFVATISLLAGLGFTALPAWRAARAGAGGALTAAPRTTTGPGRQGLQRLLVAGEVAVAVVLVIGAGLLARSFVELTRVDPGLQPDNVVTTRISLPIGSYPEADNARAFWERLRDTLDARAGVVDAAVVLALPLRDAAFTESFLRHDNSPEIVDAGHAPSFEWQMSSPGYFRTLGIPLLAGRAFTAADRAGSPRVAIVNEATVRRYFAGENPLGERIRIMAADPDDIAFEIVGVVADVRHDGPDSPAPVQIFTPFAQAIDYRRALLWSAAVALRSELEPDAAAALLREVVWSLDAELPLAEVRAMDELLRAALARPRFTTVLLALFSALALLLACIGIYGVVAYGVARRTRETGIRMALGAQRGAILALVLRQAMAPVAAGIAIGVLAALALARFLDALLYGVEPTDPATFVAVAGLLGAAALVAAWLPARRATRVDAQESLRAE